jgi:V-type H+-transporting ATPase subunit d
MATFNVDDGFLEAIARGYRGRILTREDYTSLIQADSVEDLKMHLSSAEFDYGPFLEDLQGDQVETKALEKALKRALVDEFHFVRAQATYPLSKFLDFITYGYMIENLAYLIKGTLKDQGGSDTTDGKLTEKLLESCNPLGTFPEMVVVCAATSAEEIFSIILVDTPLAKYFVGCIDDCKALNDMNVEDMKDKLYKAYLTDFYEFCQTIGGTTGEVMSSLLEYTADMRTINIAVNSLAHQNVSRDDKEKLNPPFGSLFPEGQILLAELKDEQAIYAELQKNYGDTFGAIVDKMQKDQGSESERYIEELMMEEEVRRNELAFYEQFHYGIFYSYLKLKETEIRNIVWIAECIKQNKKHRMHQNVVYIFDIDGGQ